MAVVVVVSFKRIALIVESDLEYWLALSSHQRTNRMPKDIHVEPEKFAAELISRLEGVLREREAQEKLEERLKRVRLVSASQSSLMSLPLLFMRETVGCVLKTSCLIKGSFCSVSGESPAEIELLASLPQCNDFVWSQSGHEEMLARTANGNLFPDSKPGV